MKNGPLGLIEEKGEGIAKGGVNLEAVSVILDSGVCKYKDDTHK